MLICVWVKICWRLDKQFSYNNSYQWPQILQAKNIELHSGMIGCLAILSPWDTLILLKLMHLKWIVEEK